MSTTAAYNAMTALSPYTSTSRYAVPKEDHKFIARHLLNVAAVDQPLSVVDLGCGNAELIHHLRTVLPRWEFCGVDYTSEFIETARGVAGLSGVRLECCDLFAFTGSFDVVLCTGVANIFEDIERLVGHLLEVCRADGLVVLEGIFNKHPVEVSVRFCDDSRCESQGLWRTAFNQHSRRRLSAYLKSRVRSMSFTDVLMDQDLPQDPSAPAVNSYTFRAADGTNILTNGLNLIHNRTLLTIRK